MGLFILTDASGVYTYAYVHACVFKSVEYKKVGVNCVRYVNFFIKNDICLYCCVYVHIWNICQEY